MQGKYRRGGMNRTVLRYRPPQERPPNRLRTHTRHRPDPAAADLRPNPLKTLERATGIEPATRSLGTYGHPLEAGPFLIKELRLFGQKLLFTNDVMGC